jgi:recombinational DNA repair protein (RecF pathway)
MLRKDDGIVLSVARSGESSLHVNFLGRETGKVRMVAKGVVGRKSPTRGVFEPGNFIELVYYYKEGRSVFYLKEAALLCQPAGARDSLDRLSALLAAVELLDLVCLYGHPDAAIVDLAYTYVACAGRGDARLLFLAGCPVCDGSVAGGFYHPGGGHGYCREHGAELAQATPLSEQVVALARACLESPLEAVESMSVDEATRKSLGKVLHRTYTHHVQGYTLPKSFGLMK